jgi:hypothetical protein
MLRLARGRFNTSIQYSWQDEIANTLASGWAGDPRLKKECLNSINHDHFHHPELMDRETAQITLIKAFPQDDDVADVIADELTKKYAFNSSRRGVWPVLPQSFRDNPKVVAALDQWAFSENYRDVIALHFGSLVGRTPTMKKRLFEAIEEHNPFWATEAESANRLVDDSLRSKQARQRDHAVL